MGIRKAVCSRGEPREGHALPLFWGGGVLKVLFFFYLLTQDGMETREKKWRCSE